MPGSGRPRPQSRGAAPGAAETPPAGAPARLLARTRAGEAGLPFLAAIYLVALLIPYQFELGGLALNGLRLLLLAVTVPLAVRLLAGRYGPLSWVDVAFFLHVAWIGVAMQVNNPDRMVQHVGSHAIEFIGGYLVGRATIRSRADFLALMRWLVVIVLALLPLAAFESLTGRNLAFELGGRLPGLSMSAAETEGRIGLERARAVFPHPILLGLFASAAFALVLVGLAGTWPDNRRRLAAAGIVAVAFLSLSSAPLLSLQLQLVLILWSLALARVERRWLVLIGLLVLCYVAIDLASNRSPYRVFLTYLTLVPETGFWRDLILTHGMANVRENPWFGLGLNDWQRPVFMHSASVDNFWLLIAMRYGLPGLVFLAVGFGLALLRVGLRDLGQDSQLLRLRRAWVFTFIGLSFTMATVHVWGNIFSFVFFLLGAGIWLTEARPVAPAGAGADTTDTAAQPAGGKETAAPAYPYTRFAHGNARTHRTRQHHP